MAEFTDTEQINPAEEDQDDLHILENALMDALLQRDVEQTTRVLAETAITRTREEQAEQLRIMDRQMLLWQQSLEAQQQIQPPQPWQQQSGQPPLPDQQVPQQSLLSALTAQLRVSFKEEADTLSTFSGEVGSLPVRTWIRMVAELAKASEWTAYETFLVAKQALIGPAKDWLCSQRNIGTWVSLKDGLIVAFEQSILESLRNGRPEHNEPLVQYVQRMRSLGIQGGISDRLTLKLVVDGIPDDEHNKTNLYRCRDFEELKHALDIYEAVERAVKETQENQ